VDGKAGARARIAGLARDTDRVTGWWDACRSYAVGRSVTGPG